MKKTLFIIYAFLISIFIYTGPVSAAQTPAGICTIQAYGAEDSEETDISETAVNETLADDPVELDTSGNIAMTIEDKGDFHPSTRDSVEMIIALIALIALVGFILHICDPSEDSKKEGEENKKKKNVLPIRIGGYLMVLVVMFLFFRFIIANVNIPSASMETTLMIGDRCAINRLSYIGAEPERGDIVIFRNEDEFGDDIIIKRIIGMPGDHISFKDGQVYINGGLVYEEYLDPGTVTECDGYFDVPEGCYFMMGDNRGNSDDSRYWKDPYLRKNEIMGKHILTVHLGNKK